MKILRYIKAVFVCGPSIIYYYFHYILKFVKHKEKYSFEYRYEIIRKLIRKIFKSFKVDYKTYDFDKLISLKENALIISNHLSDADPLLLIAMSEKPLTFVSKKENFKLPFVGKILVALDAFSLDRAHLLKQIGELKAIMEYLKDEKNYSVVLYAEGTRNRKPENPCLDFHPGSFKLAIQAGVPIVTVATFGTFRILDKHCYLPKNLCQFKVLDVYNADEVKKANSVELSLKIKNEIDKEVDELRKVDLAYVNNLKISKKKKELETFCDSRIKS